MERGEGEEAGAPVTAWHSLLEQLYPACAPGIPTPPAEQSVAVQPGKDLRSQSHFSPGAGAHKQWTAMFGLL